MFGIGLAALSAVVLGVGAWLYTPDKPRAALEAAYAAPPSEFVEIAGLRVHLRDTGPRDAPAVILLHGFGSSLHTWDRWADMLQADHRVVRYDQPGFGLTGGDPTGDYSDTRGVAILLGVMDRLGIAKASVVGNSMGGRIAWTFAAMHPGHVAKLVLMAPDGFASPGLAYGVAPKLPWMMRLLPIVLPAPLLRASLAPAYGDRSVMTADLLARYRDMMLAPGVRQAILDRFPQTILVDPEPLLRRIKAPTLLMWGDKDAMVPIRNAADYLRDIKGAVLATFPGEGHLLMEERPRETIRTLQAFLKQP